MTGGPLEAAVAALVLEVIRREVAPELRRIVAEEVAKGAGAEPEWLSQAAAAKVAGVAPGTIRSWQASGRLGRGLRGRVSLQELRKVLGEAGAPPAAADAPAVPVLRQERAKRAARAILAGLDAQERP